MEWSNDLRCVSCRKTQFVSSAIQIVVGEKNRILINLEGCVAARCLNCGGEFLMDCTQVEGGIQKGPRTIRLWSDEAKERINQIKTEQYDKAMKNVATA